MLSRIFFSAAVLLLVGCAAPEPLAEAPPVEPPVPARDVLAEVRAEAAGAETLDVRPIRDPDADDFVRRAAAAEQAGDFAAAAQALDRALAIAPEDPELLQLRAEMALAQGELDLAERLAAKAWELGAKVGPLCWRHWAAIRIARELRGAPQAAERAAEQAQQCIHVPPVRM